MKHILSKIPCSNISKILERKRFTAASDFLQAMWIINNSMPHLDCNFSEETVISIKNSIVCDNYYTSFMAKELKLYAKCFKFINCKFGIKTLYFNKHMRSILLDGCDISSFPHLIVCENLKVVTFKNMTIKNFIFMSDLKWDKEDNTFDIVFENCTLNKGYRWSQKSRVRLINCTDI